MGVLSLVEDVALSKVVHTTDCNVTPQAVSSQTTALPIVEVNVDATVLQTSKLAPHEKQAYEAKSAEGATPPDSTLGLPDKNQVDPLQKDDKKRRTHKTVKSSLSNTKNRPQIVPGTVANGGAVWAGKKGGSSKKRPGVVVERSGPSDKWRKGKWRKERSGPPDKKKERAKKRQAEERARQLAWRVQNFQGA